jgi:predicted GH43/DUF377 family glycosyl hydrolase
MLVSLALKDKFVSPPGGFIFKKKNGHKSSAPHIRAAVTDCARVHEIDMVEAEQRVLKDTYDSMAPNVRGHFIMRVVGKLVEQNPTFRYVPRENLSPAPYLYNPTLAEVKGKDWMIYRKQEAGGNSTIWRNLLGTNENHQIEIPKLWDTEQMEDPRAFWFDGDLHICFASWPRTRYVPQMRVVRLDKKWKFKSEVECKYAENGKLIQKNWEYFSHEDALHFIYWYTPLIIVKNDSETIRCESPIPSWDFGQMRGGTPPIRVGDTYFTFFHSRTDIGRATYHMGALSFSAKDFTPIAMTKAPLLTGTAKEPNLSWAPLVSFPGGSIYRDGKWLIALGINDVNCGLCEYSHEELLSKMTAL